MQMSMIVSQLFTRFQFTRFAHFLNWCRVNGNVTNDRTLFIAFFLVVFVVVVVSMELDRYSMEQWRKRAKNSDRNPLSSLICTASTLYKTETPFFL